MTYEDTEKRREIEYVEGFFYNVLDALETFDEDCPYDKEWKKENFGEFFYSEMSLDYDSYCDILKSDLRKGRHVNLTCEQIREILRLNHMIDQFDRYFFSIEHPQDIPGQQALMFRHPKWKKISKQSHKILGLLRRK